MGFVKAYILGMVNKKNVLSLTARSDHSSQLSYPLNGCSPAEPFYVSLNNTKLNILTQFILHSHLKGIVKESHFFLSNLGK